jgi:hypothetical protein
MPLGSTEPLTNEYQISSGEEVKRGLQAREASCEPIVKKMWERRRLNNSTASTAVTSGTPRGLLGTVG